MLSATIGCAESQQNVTPTPSSSVAPPTPTLEPAVQSPTPDVTPTATNSPALDALLVPGPTLPAPGRFFFQNGDDLWQQPAVGPATPVTSDLELGPWAQTPDGERVAAVVYQERRGVGEESIRLVDPTGIVSDPIYGPFATSGASGTAAIRSLAWSWDRTALAVMFADRSISVLSGIGSGIVTTASVEVPEGDSEPSGLAWAPSGAGLTYLSEEDDGRSTLFATANDDVARPVIDPADEPVRSVDTYVWLPGRGRIAFVERVGVAATRLPGSIFTIAPDGSVLELLVSAGQFAPAARIVTLSASSDGRDLAFTVYVPNESGVPSFQSLWSLNIDSTTLTEIPIEPGYRVTDIWWTSAGIVWRGIDINTRVPGSGTAYTGQEPFILGRFDPVSGATVVIFQSELAKNR